MAQKLIIIIYIPYAPKQSRPESPNGQLRRPIQLHRLSRCLSAKLYCVWELLFRGFAGPSSVSGLLHSDRPCTGWLQGDVYKV